MNVLLPALVFLAVCPVVVSPSFAVDNDSLQAQFGASLSVRNPRVKEKYTTRQDGIVDTTKVPFDYEFAFGLSGTYGRILFGMNYQYERQDDELYVNQEYSFRYRKPAWEVGTRLLDAEDATVYIFSAYLEAKLYGWIGIGITREYSQRWIHDGGTLARFSLARNTYQVLKMALFVRAEYEINPTRSRIFLYGDVRNFKFGRFAVVPEVRYERVKRPKADATSSYQAKVRLTIDI